MCVILLPDMTPIPPPRALGNLGALLLLFAGGCRDPGVERFIHIQAPLLAITHVRVIDGTGRPGMADRTVVVQGGRIRAIGDTATLPVPAGALSVDGNGRTLFPGLVGMHEHLFYQTATAGVPAQAALARLYLAGGVTTIRTAGTNDFRGDLKIKEAIDAGRLPGPRVHLTGPYLYARSRNPDPEGVAREVASQAERGATSFKAYTTLRASELQAAIDAAHERGLRITGHLCAVGYREAAAMGIDNLEHGLAVDTEFYADKVADVCPDQNAVVADLAGVDVATDMRVRRTIDDLVKHDVAVTSTLAVFETLTGDESVFDPRLPGVLAPWVRRSYDSARARWIDRDAPLARMWAAMRTTEMQFERAFAAAGGRLMAGVDPTGWGGIMAGFGDQRELELLVQAGLTPEAAIHVATENGADFLREGDEIGTIAAGKRADLVLVRGNPSVSISDVRNVEIVFKDGIGYDPASLIAATQGTVGQYQVQQIIRWPLNVVLLGVVLALLVRVVRLRRRIRAKKSATV
jgi:imidazolonepropionase-like amidohydrolase